MTSSLRSSSHRQRVRRRSRDARVASVANLGDGDASVALTQIIDRAFDKGSWHGANLISALRGVRAKQAARRFKNRKTIWEQALHAGYWKHIVLNKLVGTTPFPRRGSNWIAQPSKVTEQAWRADIQLLREIHSKFRAA